VNIFSRDDWFIRRVASKKHIKPWHIHWRAFKPRKDERALSYTLQDEDLRTPAGIDRYQLHHVLPKGDLPGLCRVSYVDLVERLSPPLPPRLTVDEDDDRYGHLHCSTDCPDRDHMERLAKCALENKVLRCYVRADSLPSSPS